MITRSLAIALITAVVCATFVLVPFGTPSLAAGLTSGEFGYQLIDNNSAVEIVSYSGQGGTVDIPATIEGRPVIKIGWNAFREKALASVNIPSGVTSIGAAAFFGNNLTSVTLPPNLLSIGDQAFSYNQLLAVDIPSSVWAIGKAAFAHNQLASVIIPALVSTVEEDAFAYNQLNSVTFLQSANTIPSGVSTIGYGAFRNNQLSSITLPPSVSIIRGMAFAHNKLNAVNLPSQLAQLWDRAFSHNQLRSVTIDLYLYYIDGQPFADNQAAPQDLIIRGVLGSLAQDHANANGYTFVDGTVKIFGEYIYHDLDTVSTEILAYGGAGGSVTVPSAINGKQVTSIGAEAFADSKLTSITIPQTVKRIGDGAFFNNELTNVDLPTSITSIGERAFAENSLEFLTLPSSLKSLGSAAFRNNKLTTVTLPSGLTYIANEVFHNNRLTTIAIPSTITSIGHYAFSFNQLESLELPSTLESIGIAAFTGNRLSAVVIPTSVISLNLGAFFGNQLTNVIFLSSTTILGDWVFEDNQSDPADLTIYGLLGSTAHAYAIDYGYSFVAPAVDSISVSPPSDEMTGGTEVVLSCNTAGATIYYTTDGGEPTADSAVYEGPISLVKDSTLKAIALLDGFVPSTVFEAHYSVYYKVDFLDYDGTLLKSEKLKYGQDASPPEDPERLGYNFTGWDKAYANITTHLDIAALYTPQQFTIVFDSKGGTPVEPIVAKYGSLLLSPLPVLDEFGFGGWYKDEALTQRWNFNHDTVPIGGITLYARWALFAAISGQVSDTLGPLEAAQIQVLRDNVVVAQTTTDAAGLYCFEQLVEDSYSVVFLKDGYTRCEQDVTLDGDVHDLNVLITLLGDVNLDGHINAADIVPVNRHALGIELMNNPLSLAAADVNGDGHVNAADIVPLNRHALGIELLSR